MGSTIEQFVYGKIKVVDKDKNTKFLFENVDKIINIDVRAKVKARLEANNNDTKLALLSLKKNPIILNESKNIILEKNDCFKFESVIKYPIESLGFKDLQYIVDKKVKDLIKERLKLYIGNEKEAFKTPLWFNEAKQIPIKTVRLFTKLSALEPVKRNEEGKEIGFVVPGNNHHIAIYKDQEKKYIQHACTFWHAVNRRLYNLPIIVKDSSVLWGKINLDEYPQDFLQKLPQDYLQLEWSLQQNEMFLLGMGKDEMEKALELNDKSIISKHLYIVWSISESDFWFRHHLETKNSELKKIDNAKESKRYYRFKSIGSFINSNPIKVRLNHLGEITKIGE